MFKLFFKLILVLVIVVILTAGYLGFVPGLSTIMGADKPKDLGITYTQDDFQNMTAKSGITRQTLPESTDLIQSAQYEGTHELKITYSGQDLTALVNETKWKYNPFSNVQIRINQDATTEISGNINLEKLWDYVGTNGVSTSDIEQAKKALAAIPSQPAFYAKGVTEGADNKVSKLNIESLSIGRLSVPSNIIHTNQHYLAEIADKEMSSIPGFYAKSVKAENGEVKFEGSIPDVESIVIGE